MKVFGGVMTKDNRTACYSRISTIGNGQDLSNQTVPLREYIQGKGLKLVKEYADEGISGATERRKGLDQMVSDAKGGLFKILVVMEISRLARDVRHLLNLLYELDQLGIQVVSIREGISFDTPMGKAFVAIIGILMSVERDLLRERIKSALFVKKLAAQQTGNGWRCGRPTKLTPELATKVIELRYKNGLSIRQIAKALDIAKSSVQRVLSQNSKES